METELATFKGTPAQFAVTVEVYRTAAEDRRRSWRVELTRRETSWSDSGSLFNIADGKLSFRRPTITRTERPLPSDAAQAWAELHNGNMWAWIGAQSLPAGQARIFFRGTEDAWAELSPLWADFRTELARLGWIDLQQPAAEDAPKRPRVPGRQADLSKWRACWRKIKPLWRRGQNYSEIREWLNAQDSSLEYSVDVLAEIIKAGEAGLLDTD